MINKTVVYDNKSIESYWCVWRSRHGVRLFNIIDSNISSESNDNMFVVSSSMSFLVLYLTFLQVIDKLIDFYSTGHRSCYFAQTSTE